MHDNIELLRDVASVLPDEEYDPYVHDRPDDLGPDDDDFPDDLDLSDETPEDRRTLIALMARREWMATR